MCRFTYTADSKQGDNQSNSRCRISFTQNLKKAKSASLYIFYIQLSPLEDAGYLFQIYVS